MRIGHRSSMSDRTHALWRAAPRHTAVSVRRYSPGLAAAMAVGVGAVAVARLEACLFGATWLEPLVLAILIGTAIRTWWTPGVRYAPGLALAGKQVLEVAIVLLGAAISAGMVAAAGPWLVAGIGGVVLVALGASYGIGRALGVPHKMAVLVACGNSICGNSAIAAVAPVIGADAKDVAASIAFTAVLGVGVVLGLPLLPALLHLSGVQYGVLAGLTVYAVPQVLAATVPLGAVAVQMGTLVKLVRVLMLGPVVVALSVTGRGPLPAVHRLVPWFILGFLAMAGLRSAGAIPAVMLPLLAGVASALTLVAMAALGLATDVRVVARSGVRVVATVSLSLLVLGGVSLLLIEALRLG